MPHCIDAGPRQSRVFLWFVVLAWSFLVLGSLTFDEARAATQTARFDTSRPEGTLPTTLTLTQVSNGGVGVFTFIGTNGWTTQSITTTTPGIGVTGATQTLAASGVATSITANEPPGFLLQSASCTGMGAGGTATLVGNTLTLNAAATAAGANIACTFVSARLPTLTLTQVSNGAVGSFTFTGNNGWVSQVITTTAPGVGVSGATQTLASPGVATTIATAAPPGFLLTGAFCSGMGAGGTATLAGNSLTLNAAATASGANIACTFISARLPSLTLTKISNGGVGAFTFSGTNGWASQVITTVTSGVGVSGATQTLSAPGVSTAITEIAPLGFLLTGATCTGMGSGGTAVLSGNTLVLSAAAMAAGADVACTFFSARLPTLTLTQVSNGGVGTFTFTGTNGWASQAITTTTPGVGVTGITQTLFSAGVATTINAAAPPGFTLVGSTCTGMGSGGTAFLAGNTLTLDASATAAGANIQCTFTSSQLATLTITQVSNGGVGTFTFSGTNGWVTQAITTTTPGVGVSGATQTLASAGVATSITLVAPPDFVLDGVTCTGLGSGGVATLGGNTITLNPAATAAGANIQCTFTSSRLPTLTLTQISTGGTGTFTFTGTNGWVSQAIATTTPGVGVAGATQTLASPAVLTTITSVAPPGFVLIGASCTGLGSGGTATLSGNTLTLDASATALGANIQCTFTNARLPTLTLTQISNGGIGTFTFTGTNGWVSQAITTTTPGVGVTGATQTLTSAGAVTAITTTAPPGFVVVGASCTGMGAGGTATLSGNTLTLDAAATAAGANIACTFTSAGPPSLTLTQISNGGIGTFTFTGTNGWVSQAITTTTPGVGVTGATQTLSGAGVITAITSAPPPGFVLVGASCAGMGAGGTATLAGTTLTLDAAATAAGANIACTFTSTRLPTLTLTQISNGGIGTFTFTGTNGWASQAITTTTPGVGAAGATQTLASTGVATTITAAATPGFALVGATCTGLGAGGTATLAGDTLTLDAAATAAGANIACTFTSASTIQINPSTLPSAAVGVAYNETLTATNGVAPYGFAVTSGALPPGLSLSPAGALTGTPTTSGIFGFTITASDSLARFASGTYTISVAAPTLMLQPATLPTATGSAAYSAQVTAMGGTAPYVFSLDSGALPPGLTVTANGLVSGVPTAAGSFTFVLAVVDSTPGIAGSAMRTCTLDVLAPTLPIIGAVPDPLTLSQPFTVQLTASGGATPYAFTLASGTLPPGVTLSGQGLLSGTPTQLGAYVFEVRVTDANGFTATREIRVTVAQAPVAVPARSIGGLSLMLLGLLSIGLWTLRRVPARRPSMA